MRVLVTVACLLPFALAAEAGIDRHSPEAAVKAAYAAEETAIEGRGAGVMGDNTLRARYFSRSLLRSISANELVADARESAPAIPRPAERPGAAYGGSQRHADLGDARRGESARRVRPRRRRAGAADLRFGL